MTNHILYTSDATLEHTAPAVLPPSTADPVGVEVDVSELDEIEDGE